MFADLNDDEEDFLPEGVKNALNEEGGMLAIKKETRDTGRSIKTQATSRRFSSERLSKTSTSRSSTMKTRTSLSTTNS